MGFLNLFGVGVVDNSRPSRSCGRDRGCLLAWHDRVRCRRANRPLGRSDWSSGTCVRPRFCEGPDTAIIAAIALIAIGIGMMRWVFAGAAVVTAVVGVAAAARGVSLILSGIYERTNLVARENG